MKNRLKKYITGKPEKVSEISRFFLACEFKPHTKLWSVLEPFAYNIKPAFIRGKLGVLNYEPPTYGIIELNEEDPPLIGYLLTISEPDTILLLDKIKGFNGADGFNTHVRILTHVFTDKNKVVTAWSYVLSGYVLNAYQSIEGVEFGMWDDDAAQFKLLEKIGVL